jgi:hypothetical protein
LLLLELLLPFHPHLAGVGLLAAQPHADGAEQADAKGAREVAVLAAAERAVGHDVGPVRARVDDLVVRVAAARVVAGVDEAHLFKFCFLGKRGFAWGMGGLAAWLV